MNHSKEMSMEEFFTETFSKDFLDEAEVEYKKVQIEAFDQGIDQRLRDRTYNRIWDRIYRIDYRIWDRIQDGIWNSFFDRMKRLFDRLEGVK